MAMVQLECPETGKPIDIGNVSPEYADVPMAAVMQQREIPCPHCGKRHIWSSSHMGQAMIALRDSPEATRVLVEATQDDITATALR
jgi:endogenous inhibitor of DNA gyrase (YacG/DUF329 family)